MFRLFYKMIICIVVIFMCQNAHARKKHKHTRSHRHHSKSLKNSKTNLKSVLVNANPVNLKSDLIKNIDGKALAANSAPNILSIDPRQTVDNNSVRFKTPFGQIDWKELAKNTYIQNKKYYADYNGYKLELTLDPEVQKAAQKHINQTHIINGSTVILEPSTGKILALAQKGGIENADVSVFSTAPAASLIKIITAAAAIEKRNFVPDDNFYYRGTCNNLRNDNVIVDQFRDRLKISLAKAFGISCNTVFGRIALYDVGLSSLKQYAEKFMFNKPIPSDLKIQTSMFLFPDLETATPQEVAEAGSGFGATRISPIHAAILAATVNNSGVMMAPYLIQAAYNKVNIEVYRAKPRQIGQMISKETAAKIEVLMQSTVIQGTSKRVFRKKGTRGQIDEIAGKTGTLLDPENRDMLYTWFSGIAPLNSPSSIAIGTVVASQYNRVIRASSIAQTTLADYLKINRN